MRVLLLDTENAPNYGTFWGIHEQRVRYSDITQEWFFISAQWKFLDEKKVSHVSLLDDVKRFVKDHTDDYVIVKKVHDLIEQADVMVGHNIKSHDLKKLYAKFVEHKLDPPHIPFMVDTYEWSKKFGFTSRKLGDLCKKLGLAEKLSHDPGIFQLAGQGDVKAIRKVVRYGRGDIPTLEALYLRLRPYIKNHPNQNMFKEGGGCPSCGSPRIHKKGNRYGKQEYACHDCNHRFNEDKLKRRK